MLQGPAEDKDLLHLHTHHLDPGGMVIENTPQDIRGDQGGTTQMRGRLYLQNNLHILHLKI